jgi:3-methyl-2-oxobutanoate hydroxymethyltransferase
MEVKESRMAGKKVTIVGLHAKKQRREPITMITAYDYPGALAAERAGLDSILVGDSLAMVVLGYESTVAVTMDEMLHHCRAVRRGVQNAYLIGDMPFLSYQVERNEAIRNAGRFLKEAGMDAVKLEGGREVAETLRAISNAGIAVVGHLGFTPQSVAKLGGYRVQGRTAAGARRLYEDAEILQDAGAVMLVLEMVPDRLAEYISCHLQIPTIGIGAGQGCDGQVLVLHDLLGMFDRFTPRFVRKYARLSTEIERALIEYRDDVAERRFPGPEHTFAMDETAWAEWMREMGHQQTSEA